MHIGEIRSCIHISSPKLLTDSDDIWYWEYTPRLNVTNLILVHTGLI